MVVGSGSLDWLLRLNESWEVRREQARVAVLATVMTDLQGFPLVLLEHEDLPTHRISLRQYIRLFPLGEFRRIWWYGLSGYSTLYLGSDGNLYEYGPKHLNLYDVEDPVAENRIQLRVLKLDDLEIQGLFACRDLLRRVWLV